MQCRLSWGEISSAVSLLLRTKVTSRNREFIEVYVLLEYDSAKSLRFLCGMLMSGKVFLKLVAN